TAAQSAESAPLVQRSVRVEAEVRHDTSIPLRQMPPASRARGQRVYPVLPLPRNGGEAVTAADPVLQSLIAQPLAPALTLNFDGVGNGFSGPAGTFTVAGAPPDTNGSVGPNHYVQIVNTDFAVFDKSGAALFGPVPINTLWTSFGGLLPADLDGGRQPPAGSPNYVVSLGAADGQLAFWQFHVDWATPANTTLTGPTTLTTAAFTLPCNDTGGTCVAQSGTTQRLDTLGDRLMYRLAYRNFSDHEALVVNH